MIRTIAVQQIALCCMLSIVFGGCSDESTGPADAASDLASGVEGGMDQGTAPDTRLEASVGDIGEGDAAADVTAMTETSNGVDLTGQWEFDFTPNLAETDCTNKPAAVPNEGALIEQSGNTVLITMREMSGKCIKLSGTLTGNMVTYSGAFVMTHSGCEMDMNRSGQLTFDGMDLSGTDTVEFTAVSGDCAFFGPPCKWVNTVSAQRCTNCWTGCTP